MPFRKQSPQPLDIVVVASGDLSGDDETQYAMPLGPESLSPLVLAPA